MNAKQNVFDFPDLFDIAEGFKVAPGYIVIYVLIYGIAAVIGTFGNSLIIFLTFANKKLRNNRNAFIISLSVADLLVCVVVMPASITGVLLGKKWHEDRGVFCAITSLFCSPSCFASMFSLAWIAISRHYYITKYALYLKYFTKKHIGCYVASIWAIGILVHIPNHFGWGQIRYSFTLRYCSLDTETPSYAIFTGAYLLSGVIIAFIFYLKTYLIIRKSKLSKTIILGKRQNKISTYSDDIESHPNNNEFSSIKDEIKILKATFKIFLIVLFSWSPIVILLLLSMGDKIPPWVYLFGTMTSHINSTLNFITFFFGNELFRSAVNEIFVSKIKVVKRLFHKFP